MLSSYDRQAGRDLAGLHETLVNLYSEVSEQEGLLEEHLNVIKICAIALKDAQHTLNQDHPNPYTLAALQDAIRQALDLAETHITLTESAVA